jgi:hypothetical protein
LLDAGFRVWRQNFITFFLIALSVLAPLALIQFAYDVTVVRDIGEFGEVLVDDVDAYTAMTLLFTLAYLLINVLAVGAMFALAVRSYLGQKRTVGQVLSETVRRLLPFLGLMLLFYLGVGFGMIALIVPGIFLAVSWAFIAPAFWAEGAGVFTSYGRSWRLISGRRWTVLGLVVIGFLVYAVVSAVFGVVGLILLFTDNTLLFLVTSDLINAVVSAVALPLFPSILTAAYYDARVRKEAFDLELAARHLDSDNDSGGAGPTIFR